MALDVVRVDDRAALARFIDVPWRIYSDTPGSWIPPLRIMVKETLDPGRDPFWKHADRALFLALRDGRPVGRIAAIENRSHNEHHHDRVGFFGFFESLDDAEVAGALLSHAAAWLKERGLSLMRGPVSPSVNHECGLLVDGFEPKPCFLTPWNHPYYGALLEGQGLVKERDLLGFWIRTDPKAFDLTPVMVRAAERARARLGRLTFKSLDGPGLAENAELCRVIFNEAWGSNWGFVPIKPEEFAYLTKELKPVLASHVSFVAQVDGEPAGFMVIVRELNEILERIPSGRLLPTGIFKLLAGGSRIRRGRVILLGIRERYRGQHIFPLFMQELLRRSRDPGFNGIGAEASWVLEDNESLIRPLTAMGAAPYKRWRIYQKEL
jgi:GNAT superfamily N-acetyltransferase